jgi:glycosyltransferase involved in cell wall biosynthesis
VGNSPITDEARGIGDPEPAGATPVLASVIVPVRNRRGDLLDLIEALSRQTIPREQFEVIIGDDGSTDGSSEGLETADGWIRVMRGSASTSYAARNRAARNARSSVLAFCDADCKPDSRWLESGLHRLADADIVAGRIRFILPEKPTIWTLLDIDASKNHARLVRLGNAETANLFVRRDLFERVNGFVGSIPHYGDFDFVSRCVDVGARLVFAPEAIVWHPTIDSGRAYLRRAWRTHRWYATRVASTGRRPTALKLREWVPAIQTFRSRRRFGMSVGLDRQWLRENGVIPRIRNNLVAIPILYLVGPYLQGFAQVRGWWAARGGR